MSIMRSIWVTFQREGIHCYPRALTDTTLEDVRFLGHPHRHMFHFKVFIDVEHNERDIEFIQFKRWIETSLMPNGTNMNDKSCETLATELMEKINARYPHRVITVEVSEDGENGAILTWDGHGDLND